MSKKVKIKASETVDAFSKRFNVKLDDVYALNKAVEGFRDLRNLDFKKPLTLKGLKELSFDTEKELEVPDDASESGTLNKSNTDNEPLKGFGNDENNWLTYETIFNMSTFRKTNQKFSSGLYAIPLKELKIILMDETPDELLKELINAFFPNSDIEYIKKLSDSQKVWAENAASGTVLPSSSSKAVASGLSASTINIPPVSYAVMPYNLRDNDAESNAIGTVIDGNWKRIKDNWDMWNTASRSSIMQLKPVKTDFDAGSWPDTLFGHKRKEITAGKIENDLGNFKGAEAFKVKDSKACFSVKTGVCYIGKSFQGGDKHKDKLEKNNIISSLRSDYIVKVDKETGKDNDSPVLIIQKELLTVTVPQKDDDGFSVRDISYFRQGDKIVIPPLSIPYMDSSFSKIVTPYSELLTKPDWADFWEKNYARNLGICKAKFLLRYGLQMNTPNPQNFLLEFTSSKKPTDTVIFRDIGDANLHREIIWAVHGSKGNENVSGADLDQLKDRAAELDMKVLQFEYGEEGKKNKSWELPYDTIANKKWYDKKGTQFQWCNYSVIFRPFRLTIDEELEFLPLRGMGEGKFRGEFGYEYKPDDWKKLIKMMAKWGRTHNRSYTEYINKSLNLNIQLDYPPNDEDLNDIDNFSDTDHAAGQKWWNEERENREFKNSLKLHDTLLSTSDLKDRLKKYLKK